MNEFIIDYTKCFQSYNITQFKMGSSNSKKVEADLQQKYKPIRKYYDDFYGEITVLQNRKTLESHVKVQKLVFYTKRTSEYINHRLNKKYPMLVDLKAVHRCPIDMCSQNEMCVFLLEYIPKTLAQQIQNRNDQDIPFRAEQIVHLFHALTQAVKLQRQIDPKLRKLISTVSFLYISPSEIKIMQSLFCTKNESPQTDFSQIMSSQSSHTPQSKQYYLSPQSFNMLCRKQKIRAKETSLQQTSMVFTLGMIFLECLLLIQLSEIYNKDKKQFEFEKLHQLQKQILQIYGQEMQKLICSMTQASPARRPSLRDIEQYLKFIAQSYSLKLAEYESLPNQLIK